MCEGFRAALITAAHMSLAVVYLVFDGFAALFLYLVLNGFKKRVLSLLGRGVVCPWPSSRYPPRVRGGIKLSFHGVRGSTPCAGDRYERYGGNTSCVALEADGHDSVIFDMGTGLRPCGQALAVDGAFHGSVLLTHLHW